MCVVVVIGGTRDENSVMGFPPHGFHHHTKNWCVPGLPGIADMDGAFRLASGGGVWGRKSQLNLRRLWGYTPGRCGFAGKERQRQNPMGPRGGAGGRHVFQKGKSSLGLASGPWGLSWLSAAQATNQELESGKRASSWLFQCLW